MDDLSTLRILAPFLHGEEGCRLQVYSDPVGIPTIGWGHRLTPREIVSRCFAGGISPGRADQVFARDISWALRAVDAAQVCQSSHERAALCSATYNLGHCPGDVVTYLRAHPERPCHAVALAGLFGEYDHGGPDHHELAILRQRRAREAALFLEPDASEPIDVREVLARVDAAARQMLASDPALLG